jgi:hypothetical protein
MSRGSRDSSHLLSLSLSSPLLSLSLLSRSLSLTSRSGLPWSSPLLSLACSPSPLSGLPWRSSPLLSLSLSPFLSLACSPSPLSLVCRGGQPATINWEHLDFCNFTMFSRIFGKPKEEVSTLSTLDKLNEVRGSDGRRWFGFLRFGFRVWVYHVTC